MRSTVVLTALSRNYSNLHPEKLEQLARTANFYSQLGGDVILALSRETLKDSEEFLSAMVPKAVTLAGVNPNCNGALATAYSALASRDGKGKLLVAAGDIEHLEPETLSKIENLWSSSQDGGGLLAFEGGDERYSFIKTNADGVPVFIAEKSAVGRLAATGDFAFSGLEVFNQAAEWCFRNSSRVNGQYYVSTAMNYILYRGKPLEVEVLDRADFIKHFR